MCCSGSSAEDGVPLGGLSTLHTGATTVLGAACNLQRGYRRVSQWSYQEELLAGLLRGPSLILESTLEPPALWSAPFLAVQGIRLKIASSNLLIAMSGKQIAYVAGAASITASTTQCLRLCIGPKLLCEASGERAFLRARNKSIFPAVRPAEAATILPAKPGGSVPWRAWCTLYQPSYLIARQSPVLFAKGGRTMLVKPM